MDSVLQCCLLHLGSNDILDHICKEWDKMMIEDNVPAGKRKQIVEAGKIHLFSTIVLFSPFLLFRLLEVSKLREFLRILYRDGMHGCLLDGSKLIVHMVSPDTRSRKSQDWKVTSKAPIAFADSFITL